MKVRFVKRTDVKARKRGSSKFKPLLDALSQLTPGGDAVEVSYTDDKELNSMRNVVYTWQRESGLKVKSNKNTVDGKIFFFRDK
jgi:hypothetical protein